VAVEDAVELARWLIRARRIPAPVRWAMGSLIGMQTILEDPAKAALEHPVFELHSKP